MSSDLPNGDPSPPPEPAPAELAALLRERGAPLLEALAAHAPRAREDAEATATYAFAAAVEIGFERQRCELLRELARLGEIGLVYVPAAVLEEPPAKRGPEDVEALESRHEAGYGLALGAGIPESACGWLLRARERYDGAGPEGLAGEQIPIESRLVRAAATCQAALAREPDVEGMRAHRSAILALTLEAGEELDPRAAGALVAVLERAAGPGQR